MMESFPPQVPTLEGQSALAKWRQGPEIWNRWARQNPGYDISFAGVDFTNEPSVKGSLDFSGYYFGTGKVDFSDAVFGNKDVNFAKADFGDGDVDFTRAIFGNGNLTFSEAIFGEGEVKFSKVNFGDGDVDLSGSVFGEGNIIFSESTFGKGNITFYGTNFSDGYVDFSSVIFGDGHVSFSLANFSEGHLDFSFATFGNGNVSFAHANFGNANVDFAHATFGNGNVDFSHATFDNCPLYFYRTVLLHSDVLFHGTRFGSGAISFRQMEIKSLNFIPQSIESAHIQAKELSIKGRAIFTLPPSASSLKSFNLNSASFDGILTLTGDLNIIPDLRGTRYSHQVDLSELNVKLPRIWAGLGWPPKLSLVAEDPQDGARLRRLKEIAETNKDHQAALRFSADENRAKRWIETSWFGSVLDMAFSFFSNYGQSILRPTFWLGVIFALSMYAYKAKQLPKLATDGWADWVQAALLSASNSLPFLPQSRELRTGALKALYDTTDPSSYVDALMITQGVLSFVFLFLIGLGLRNRFRL